MLWLTSLTCTVYALGGNVAEFQLGALPLLQRMTLLVDGAMNLAATPGGFPRLKHLELTALAGAAVDFAAMPALASALLYVEDELQGAASIAAATALTRVEFLDYVQEPMQLEKPGVMELLRALPRSCRGLSLVGDWDSGVAETVGQLPSVQALKVCYWNEGDDHYPAESEVVWAGLRALSVDFPEEQPCIPEASCRPVGWGTCCCKKPARG